MLINYIGSQFEGACTIDDAFKPYLDSMNTIAAKYGITVVVIDSLRKSATSLPGEIVPPAKMSNHLVGHAVDVNLKYQDAYMNSKVIQTMYATTDRMKGFINECIEAGLRWGGLFSTPDPVHFDDGLNIHQPDKWHQLYNAINHPLAA